MKQDKNLKIMLAVFILLACILPTVFASIPSYPDITYNTTETVTPKPATYLNTTGGSFTTLVLNATAQDYKWKAYVGNASGRLALSDQDNFSIYDWIPSTISGNVFVSRTESGIDWANLSCAQRSVIEAEDTLLNINSSWVDSINSTFNDTAHKQFYAASQLIPANNCSAISTYINGTAQSSGQNNLFQEILLQDTYTNLIYTTILEESASGFDNGVYDFQMIVAEDETAGTTTPYYFYLELI